jgi:hypothetical protein
MRKAVSSNLTDAQLKALIKDDLAFLRLLSIKDKRNRITFLNPNPAQVDFYHNMTGRDLVLKARQLGFSTFIQGLYYKRTTSQIGINTVTISHDKDSTRKLRDKFHLFYRRLPEQFKPQMGKNDKVMSTFPALESSSYIGTAGNKAFGRGDTLSQVHCSELAFWPDPETVLTGLLEAVPDRHIAQNSSIVIESTANGASGTFFDMCMEALPKEQGGKGKGEWKLHFYAWWWDNEYQIPIAKGEKFECTSDELGLIDKHGLSLAQIKWRRNKIDRLGEKFFQEYPEDPISCFLLSGRGRFDRNALKIRLDTQCHPPIEGRLHIVDNTTGNDVPRWRIYEEPIPGETYVIGADPSEGINADSSAAVVRHWRSNSHVATLHGQFELVDFARYLRELAIYYNNAFLGIERNNHGHTVINYLMTGTETFGSYANLYMHTDQKFGWHTNSATRPVMIDDLADEIRHPDEHIIRDEAIVNQHMRFVVKFTRSHREHAEADKAAYDDLVMANAIAGQLRKVPSSPAYDFVAIEQVDAYEHYSALRY